MFGLFKGPVKNLVKGLFKDLIRVVQILLLLLLNCIGYGHDVISKLITNYCSGSQTRDERLDYQFCIDNNLLEADGGIIYGVKDHVITNWAKIVKPQRCTTFVPITKSGICNIVKWARRHNKKVRAGGFRHTFSKFYPDSDNYVFISMISLRDAELLPARQNIPLNYSSDLTGIEVIKVLDNGKALVKVGAATTNEQFREWAVNSVKYGAHAWTLPLNVILTEITLGGSNATMSHGGGLYHKTLSDLVREIEFVNVNGEIQVVNDPDQLKAVAGSLGLFGITTSLVLELDVMTYANFKPYSSKLALTIPPLNHHRLQLPAPVLDKIFKHTTDEQLAQATANFYGQCHSYYSEWFWFVFNDDCFVNVWDNDGKKSSRDFVVEYHNTPQTQFQKLSSYLADVVLPYIDMSGFHLSAAMGHLGHKAINDACPPAVTPLINALHFKRGIHDINSRNIEAMIPIPDDGEGNPDFTICQRAWWDLICLMYDYRYNKNYNPVQVTIEMRLLADSDMYLAPENGNTHGTCGIEFSTTGHANQEAWHEFCQRVCDIWYNYKDRDGNYLKVRPHYAKDFDFLTVRGTPILEYLRDINRPQYDKFKQQASLVASAGGYARSDLSMFSNTSIDTLDIY